MRSSAIGGHLPLLGSGMMRAPAALGPLGALGLAALAAVLPLAGEGLGALGAAGDRPHPGALPRGAAFAVELPQRVGAAGGELLGAADPRKPLPLGSSPGRQDVGVERQKGGVEPAGR